MCSCCWFLGWSKGEIEMGRTQAGVLKHNPLLLLSWCLARAEQSRAEQGPARSAGLSGGTRTLNSWLIGRVIPMTVLKPMFY